MKVKLFAKKLFFVLMCFLLVPFFAGCGENKNTDTADKSNNSSQNSSTESNKAETKKANLSLVGEWKEEKSFNIVYKLATIKKDSIEINEISNDGKTKTLRWFGTYKEPESSDDKYTWKSKKNSEKTKDAILAYKEDTIEFSYENGTLSYSTNSLGTTTTVNLKKADA